MNNFEEADSRLSATSRAFYEKYNGGRYELIPEFNYEKMGKIFFDKGDILLTSYLSFVSPVYITFNFNYEELKTL
jgi:hypothetical protein